MERKASSIHETAQVTKWMAFETYRIKGARRALSGFEDFFIVRQSTHDIAAEDRVRRPVYDTADKIITMGILSPFNGTCDSFSYASGIRQRAIDMTTEPMQRSKAEYAEIIDRISVQNSPVGIDAQLTHAIIIAYLQHIAERLDRIEAQLANGA